MAGQYQLSSTQTALAILVPQSLSQDVDSIRREHDKAFEKWPAHINLLYPFVPPAQLSPAVSAIKNHLTTEWYGQQSLAVHKVGQFEHRKNATVFLRPLDDASGRLCRLRSGLVAALGCRDADGTVDGEYRPHLTLGQAALNSAAFGELREKVSALRKLDWTCTSLAVLKRMNGVMHVVEHVPLANPNPRTEVPEQTTSTLPITTRADSLAVHGWKSSYSFNGDSWISSSAPDSSADISSVLVCSFNAMNEPAAPPIEDRLPIFLDELRNLTIQHSGSSFVLFGP